jgi:NADPH-dependent 2,4-dienoyl-CoA reductase/sulfur reductase-like enzyme/rhodanese-related sulfurtransferase
MKYVIVGGVAGGATAAARIRRNDEHGEIILFERGRFISFANCGLPYYIGGEIKERNDLLVQSVSKYSNRYDIDVRILSEVTGISRKEKKLFVRDLKSGKEYCENYDKLLLSPGAEPVLPPIPGIKNPRILTLRNIPDTDNIKSYIQSGSIRKAVVVGGGFIGLEMAENLKNNGVAVTIIEMARQVLSLIDYPMATIVHKQLADKGVDLILSDSVIRFEESGETLKVYLNSGRVLETDLVIWSTGVRPETPLATGSGLETGISGGIRVNEYLETSDPDIYAAGDAIETINLVTGKPAHIPLAGPANKQGRIAADNMVYGNMVKYKGSAGTGIVRIFDLTVASTGVCSDILKREGIPHVSSYTHSGSHASYFPGRSDLAIHILFSPGDGRLLGAQIVGHEGTDKRIDLFSQIIRRSGTIYELTEIEHAYAPPFSSAKDPVNISGFVAENILQGRVRMVYAEDICSMDKNEILLLDVRSPEEVREGFIPDSLNIPQEELRFRLDELPVNKFIVIYCAIGMRAYLSYRILSQNGFENIAVMSGGYTTYNYLNIERERVNKRQ